MSIPFTPAIYEHAAALIGRSPWEVSRDEDLLVEAHLQAYREYRHTPVVVGIDIYNLEAEAYGGPIDKPSDNNIPAINDHIYPDLASTRDMPGIDPASDGRLAMFIRAGQRLAEALPDADIRIPVSGPFSIAASLRGITGLCEDVIDYPAETADWLMRLAKNQGPFFEAVVAAGLDVAFFESAAAPPLISPTQFRDIELPALNYILKVAAEAVGHALPCIMGGNTYLILDDLLSTGTGYVVCNVETDQTNFVTAIGQKYPEVTIRINMDPVILVQGSRDEIIAEVERVLVAAGGHTRCVMGTGALPYETPREHVHLVQQYLTARSGVDQHDETC